jgi:hypothetical protein
MTGRFCQFAIRPYSSCEPGALVQFEVRHYLDPEPGTGEDLSRCFQGEGSLPRTLVHTPGHRRCLENNFERNEPVWTSAKESAGEGFLPVGQTVMSLGDTYNPWQIGRQMLGVLAGLVLEAATVRSGCGYSPTMASEREALWPGCIHLPSVTSATVPTARCSGLLYLPRDR